MFGNGIVPHAATLTLTAAPRGRRVSDANRWASCQSMLIDQPISADRSTNERTASLLWENGEEARAEVGHILTLLCVSLQSGSVFSASRSILARVQVRHSFSVTLDCAHTHHSHSH